MLRADRKKEEQLERSPSPVSFCFCLPCFFFFSFLCFFISPPFSVLLLTSFFCFSSSFYFSFSCPLPSLRLIFLPLGLVVLIISPSFSLSFLHSTVFLASFSYVLFFFSPSPFFLFLLLIMSLLFLSLAPFSFLLSSASSFSFLLFFLSFSFFLLSSFFCFFFACPLVPSHPVSHLSKAPPTKYKFPLPNGSAPQHCPWLASAYLQIRFDLQLPLPGPRAAAKPASAARSRFISSSDAR